ncbi:MAG: ABC transporter ATP-binding protein [Acidobacteriota bacterium]|nr:ABC transporter ATP-binding protein [Acidobacteriota bacterium]
METTPHLPNLHSHHLTPYQRLRALLSLELPDLVAILIYTSLIGLLALAVPLAAQALVNTIAAGVLMQPLIVLTAGVLGALLIAGVLRLLKLTLLEKLQQRIFARISLELAERLPRIEHDVLTSQYAPHLVNRFFDVIMIQKTAAKILLDGPGSLLQVLVGLVILAFYSPYLLAFDFFLILFVVLVVWGLGYGGLRTSIEESIRKYRVADWLEEVTRCQRGFKLNAAPAFSVERADQLVVEYTKARRRHFRVLFRQAFGAYFFKAVASAGVLAISGWLVINRQFTLGQVVAAEIIVFGMLENLEKLIRLMENGYDLLTSLDKVGHLSDLPVERTSGRQMSGSQTGASVVCRKVHFSYEDSHEILSGLELNLKPGEHVSLVGESGMGKSTLAALLCGLHAPKFGLVQINGMDVRDARLDSLRRVVSLVGDSNEVFAGTIEENILLGRDDIAHEDLQWALELTNLSAELEKFPRGLQTQLAAEGRNLSRGQLQRLLITRAIVARPQLLILDEGFTGIDEHDKLRILDQLYSPQHSWTIIDISHDPELVLRSQKVYVLAEGRILESGHSSELIGQRSSQFTQLFPSLQRREVKLA